MSIDVMTPAMAAACEGEINKWWVSFRGHYGEAGRLGNPRKQFTFGFRSVASYGLRLSVNP